MEEISLKLWTVTSAALPSMINLEHLTFGSILQSPSAQIIQNCHFQLKSLHWKSGGDSEALCTDFLPSRNRMEHLDLEFFDSDLPQGLCPRLKSIRGTQATWLSIREGRTILALDAIFEYRRHNLGPPIPVTPERLATRNLIERDIAFLACERFALLHQVIGDGGLSNLVLLQINKTCVFDIERLSQFAFHNMRVLVFVSFKRGRATTVHLEIYLPGLFNRNQRLAYVDVEMDDGIFHRYYRGESVHQIFQFDSCYTWVENHMDEFDSKDITTGSSDS